ncbi:MAG TPA: hypothetical protein PK239_12020, partial [Chitinophagales bacterium]|nr:hypothetical protein [Chitinophagales bacterium]
MKKLFSSLYFQVLVFSIVVGAMLGCGSWFGGRQKDAASAQTANTNTRLVPLDSLLVKKECYSMEVLGRLAFKNDTLSHCIYYFDTTKCKLRPDLSYTIAFTKPEFKQFFNIPPDFTVEYWKDITGYHHYWMYYKGIRIDCHSPIGLYESKHNSSCAFSARINYFYPKGELENIQVSPEVAIDSAVAYY